MDGCKFFRCRGFWGVGGCRRRRAVKRLNANESVSNNSQVAVDGSGTVLAAEAEGRSMSYFVKAVREGAIRARRKSTADRSSGAGSVGGDLNGWGVARRKRVSARRFLPRLESVSGECVMTVFSDLVRFSAALDGIQRSGW